MSMNFQSIQKTEHKRNTVETPLVVVEKLIPAPAHKVFQAWVDEDLVKQWWGPEGFDCPEASIEFWVGGRIHCCMRNKKDGSEIWSIGKFLEIEPNVKIVCTDYPSNRRGEIVSAEEAGMGPFADVGEAFLTVEFSARDDSMTLLTLSHEGLPARMHDECIDGWSSSLDKLVTLLSPH